MYKAVLFAFLAILLCGAGITFAAGQERTQTRDQEMNQEREQLSEQNRLADGEPIYGWQLMSAQERLQYRQQMRALRTREEREQLRRRHHEEMQERARAMGKTLPDYPSDGMRRGYGSGGGYGGGRGGGK